MKRWLLPAVIGLFIISSTTFVVLLIASTSEISDEEDMAVEKVSIIEEESKENSTKIVEFKPEKSEKVEKVEKIPGIQPIPIKQEVVRQPLKPVKPKEIVTAQKDVQPVKYMPLSMVKPEKTERIERKTKIQPMKEIKQEVAVVAAKPEDTLNKELSRLAEEKKQVEDEKARLKEEKRLIEAQLQQVKDEKQKVVILSKMSPENEQQLLQAEKDTIELQKKIADLQSRLVSVETDKKKLAEEKKLLEEAKKQAEENSIWAVRGKKESEKEKRSVAEEKDLYQERSLRVEERISLIMDAYSKESDYAIADAKKAIARAKAAGAVKYEPVWLKEAEEALELSDAAQKAKDYGKSLVSAVESKEKASAAERNSREKLKNYNSNMVGECLRLISNWAH